jgi:hypothetical protein
MKRTITLLILMLLLLSTHASAQSPAPQASSQTSKEEEEKARQELERKVLLMLEEVVSDSQMLKLSENRAIIQVTAGDLVWTRDEKRARGFFRDGLTGIGEAFAKASEKDPAKSYSYWMLIQLRQQLLTMIARRDPQLALDLLAATRPPKIESQASGYEATDYELMLEQSLASAAAANDPKRALQMAEDSLSKGVSYSLLAVLRRLQQKDPDAAQRLLSDIIKKLQTENLSRNPVATFVAQDLLTNALRSRESGGAKEQGANQPKPLSFDDQAKRDLADVVTRAALSARPNDPSLVAIQSILPELEKIVPERVEGLRKRVDEAKKMLDPEARRWMELEPLMRNGPAEAIIEAAGKAPQPMRNPLYNVAASKLLEAGDVDRARQLINDNMTGTDREQALSHLDQRLIARALEQGKTNDAKQLIARIQSKPRRVAQLALLAIALGKKGERKTALELLEETRNLVNREPENQEELNMLLVVARAYAAVEPMRSFELIEPVVDQANEMISAAALLDKFGSGQGMFRKGEMVLQPSFIATNTMFAPYVRQLGALARADFNRTKAVADRFQRSEVRLMARLLIAQSVLSDHMEEGQEGNYAPADGIFITSSESSFSTSEY